MVKLPFILLCYISQCTWRWVWARIIVQLKGFLITETSQRAQLEPFERRISLKHLLSCWHFRVHVQLDECLIKIHVVSLTFHVHVQINVMFNDTYSIGDHVSRCCLFESEWVNTTCSTAWGLPGRDTRGVRSSMTRTFMTIGQFNLASIVQLMHCLDWSTSMCAEWFDFSHIQAFPPFRWVNCIMARCCVLFDCGIIVYSVMQNSDVELGKSMSKTHKTNLSDGFANRKEQLMDPNCANAICSRPSYHTMLENLHRW